VVLLSEVPAGKQERVRWFCELLSNLSGSAWALHASQPSAAGKGAAEVHIALVRPPLRVVGMDTLVVRHATHIIAHPLIARSVCCAALRSLLTPCGDAPIMIMARYSIGCKWSTHHS
jgi:hypothetical protein